MQIDSPRLLSILQSIFANCAYAITGGFMNNYFHGKNKRHTYFEGWYFRCQSCDGRSIALIPAVHISESGQKSASIQVITETSAWWIDYPADSLCAETKSLQIQIAENLFSEEGMKIDIKRNDLSLSGSVTFGSFHALKSDIMGPFRWLPGLECSHSVISMGHSLCGKLVLNGSTLDLNNGFGYIESDRGRSFPSVYLWTQCLWNGGSLMLSVATIPMGMLRFTGCICAMIHKGKEYRIATYRGAKIESWSAHGATIRQGKYRLEVQLLNYKPQLLRAPESGNMRRTVQESLCAEVRFRLWRNGTLLLEHTDMHAGFEFAKLNQNNGNSAI